ncbi:hypothetical protein HQ545_07885 [Candidatus Woesearchaeota archaeon]|nr:hypothetical protein [Candidatus Woesearchaeota archaeon]
MNIRKVMPEYLEGICGVAKAVKLDYHKNSRNCPTQPYRAEFDRAISFESGFLGCQKFRPEWRGFRTHTKIL